MQPQASGTSIAMPFSGFFNTVDSGFRRDGFPEFWEDFPDLKPTFAASPDQLSQPLPDLDPSFSWPQSSSSTYPHVLDGRRPSNFTAAPPNPNVHTSLNFHGWPLQTDHEPVQYHTPIFNPQDFVPTPTSHQQSATFNAGRSSMRNDLQGCSSAIANSSSPVPDALYSPSNPFSPARAAQFHYTDSPVFVDQTKPSNFEMGTAYRQIQLTPAGAMQSSSSIPSDLALQPVVPPFFPEKMPRRNPREGRSGTSSLYHPIRTLSLPVQAVSPKEMSLHTCQWIGDDGIICGGQITYASVPEHLTTHGVKKMAHGYRLPCRWLGCRLRRDKDSMMNRESIVRHVREKHLGHRRTL